MPTYIGCCCWGLGEQVGVKPIRNYSDKMQAEDVKKAIIVVKGGITPFARSAIQELCAQREVSTRYLSMQTQRIGAQNLKTCLSLAHYCVLHGSFVGQLAHCIMTYMRTAAHCA